MKSEDHRDIRFGIDIGGLYVKAVAIDRRCRIQARFYRAHRGEPGAFLTQAMAKLGITARASVSITGSAADLFADTIGTEPLDITRCQIKAVHRLLPQAKQIIDIGGSSSTLVRLDDKGRFQGYSTNSLCAAGTGSFLDD